jgi:hypothetical protein
LYVHAALLSIMSGLPAGLKADPAVAHALGVREAVNLGNYCRLFKLYRTCPNMGMYVMDGFVDRERKKAMRVMLNAYVAYCARVGNVWEVQQTQTAPLCLGPGC